jgi:TolB-like protein
MTFPLIYEIAGHRRCYLVSPGNSLVVGSGIECQIRLEWDGIREVEAALEILGESRVRLTIPGENDVEAEIPLNISIGERELIFFRPVDTHGWSEPVAGTEGGREISISCGGKAPFRRRLQASSPLLIGSDESCSAIVPGEDCPSVAVAVWWRGENRVLIQVLDNSAPVEWENRAEAFEGEVELPLALSIAGKLVSAKASPNAQTKLPTVELEQPNRQPLSEQQARGGKKSSWLVVAGVGVFAMLLTASAIQFLKPTKKEAAPVAGTLVLADSAAPNGGAPETLKSPPPAAETVSVPIPLVQSTPPQEPPAKPTPQPTAAVNKGPATVAVLEFENSSKKEDMESLRKGLRDMMMTDLSQVSSIKMVERGRLQDLLQEMKLAEGQFIDPATAAKLGKGLAATAVLTGSYLAIGDNIRIDARMVKVETGEVMMAEQVSGSQPDFFTLQKVLAEKMVERLEVNATPQEQLALRRPQTANFDAFTAYSRGVLALEKGDKNRARKELTVAVQKDASFKLASTALDDVEREAKKALSFLDLRAQELSKTVQERFDIQFSKYRSLAEGAPQASAEYFAAPVIAAAHYGLRGKYQDEWKMLLAYSERLSSVFKEKDKGIYDDIRMILVRETLDMLSMAKLTGGKGPWDKEGAELMPGSGAKSIALTPPSFSYIPPGGLTGESPSRLWGLLEMMNRPEAFDPASSRENIEKCLTSPDELEFPDCWSMAAVKAGLSDMSQTHRRAIRIERMFSVARASGVQVAPGQVPKSEIAKFDAPTFSVLSGILQSYSSADLTQYRRWNQDWHTVAQMAVDTATLGNQIPPENLEIVIATLRYVAGASNNVAIQRKANEAMLTLVQAKR